MLDRIIAFSIRNKLIIGILVLALVIYGVLEFRRLPIDAVPDITNNQVQVITTAPALGATDIERLITFPIEQANNNIPGLLEIRSFSRFGLSLVTIVFDDNTDVYWARQQVAERLQKVQAEIPQGLGIPELGPVSTGLGEIYQYVVRPKKGYENVYDATALRTIQDWIVRRQLLGVRGVAEVSSFGGKLKTYTIEIDPAKLQSHAITINEVFNALQQNNQNTGGAYIEKGPNVLFIRSEGLINTPEELQEVIIRHNTGASPLLLKDIGRVVIGHATRYGAMCYNNKGEVAGAVVMMLKGANSSEVIKRVKERVGQIQKTLPEGVVIEAFLDRTKMVNNAIGTVEQNLMEGALIVVFVLVLFLGNLRAGILVASVIPLAMLFAVVMMNLFGVSGNLMSLGALDFGLIVDGAVIIVEAVMHMLTHSKRFSHIQALSQHDMDHEVKGAASKMMNSAVFGQIIILIVYLPIFTLQGIEGKMFRPMAQTVAFALLGAFILSLTWIPMMSALFLSKKIRHKPTLSDRGMAVIECWYQHALNRVISYPKTVLIGVFALFLLAVGVLTQLGGEFIPALEEGDFAVDTRALTGSNLPITIEQTQKAASILLQKFPEVEKVVTKIGSGEVPTDPMPIEASDMMVILKDKKEWTSAKTFSELSEKMGTALADVPGITTGFQFPVQMRFNELMTGARQDVVCKIFGENLDTLARYATQLGTIVNTVKGTANLYVETVSGLPQIIIRYNRSALAEFNLSVADVNRVVNTAFAGQPAGLLFEGEKRFDIVLRLQDNLRTDLKDVQQLLIPTPGGGTVPLEQVASVQIENGPNQIQREDAKRRIVTGFNVRGRDVESIVKELQQKVDKSLKLPPGYYITYGGAFENLNAAKERLAIAVPISLLMIFFLLYMAFGSVKQGLLIYSAIPLSAIGGILFLALRGMPFSISAGVGFIALFGVAVLNGIVLIAEFNLLHSEGMHDVRRIVLMGTKVRLRPVLMTAFVASLGFLPMAVSNGAGAEVQRPLATVVIGGLLIATFLTLFVLPVLYMLAEKKSVEKHSTPKHAALLVLLVLSSILLPAQSPISVDAAIDSALKNNHRMRSEQLRNQYLSELASSSVQLPKTSLLAEAGQINSTYTDTRFTISQSTALPVVYKRQRALLQEEWKAGTLQTEAEKARLRKEVRLASFYLINLKERKQLIDSLLLLQNQFLQRAGQRLQRGESNQLELSMAQLQVAQLENQRLQLSEEFQIRTTAFQLLINTQLRYEPVRQEVARIAPTDTAVLMQHPELRVAAAQVAISRQTTQVEQSKLLPEFSLGYSNGSIRGVGADEIKYDALHRFSSFQLGAAIPIFNKAQKARVRSARIAEQLAESKLEGQHQVFLQQYNAQQISYQEAGKQVQHFETNLLPPARQIMKRASEQLRLGEINYLQWIQLISQATLIQSEYLMATLKLQEATAGLLFFTEQ